MSSNLIPIEKVSGVGPKLKKELNKNKIWSTYDLVQFFPFKYERFDLITLDKTKHNEIVTIQGEVISNLEINNYSKLFPISFKFDTNGKVINIIAFNQKFLINNIKLNDTLFIKGKYDYFKNQIVASKVLKEATFNEIKPVYKIEEIGSTTINKIIANIFKESLVTIFENLPTQIINNYKLLSRYQAIRLLHLPNNFNDIKDATKRIKYEEAYLFQKKLISNINKRSRRDIKKYDIEKIKDLIQRIPYELTTDQKSAINDIFRDYKKEVVSYRLVQGDVGSGKTVVAAIAIYGAITAKQQVVLMAPTELLAKQHFKYFKELLKDCEIELLTSDTKNKENIKNRLKDGKIDLIVGTHALIEEDVIFNDLGLIVIDEQHKFGVRTRNELIKKGSNTDLLYLTATPIPRTLAISLFGDASISVIKEKPLNRKPINTKYILDDNLDIIFESINETLDKNEKVYIVVPAISSTHAKYNIENVYQMLLNRYNEEILFVMHGKNKKNEQEDTISEFINSKNAILLATTMIEVGIDVAAATLMIIFSADFFGLSQLHQLRGRVGRSNLESTCLLVSTKEDVQRLTIIENTSDGFLLSEHDLKLRGPGALLGIEQSGIPDFKYLDFIDDYDILRQMREELNKNV